MCDHYSKPNNLIEGLFGPNTRVSMQVFEVPSGEDGVVWLEDPSQYPFVRCRIVNSFTRNRKITVLTSGRVLGYSTVGHQAKVRGGRYQRRIFYVTKEDMEPNCIYRQTNHLPIEGVRPLTIQPGFWGNR